MNIEKYIETISKNISRPIVCYDLETTNLCLKTAQIIQFCGIRILPNSTKTKNLNFLCKPTCDINPKASEVHGHTLASLGKYDGFNKYIKPIEELFVDADIFGYNISDFDNIILDRQMSENGKKDFLKDKRIYDTYKVYCNHINKKLGGAVEFYSGDIAENCHEAMQDVKYTILVTGKQIQKESLSIDNIIDKLSAKAKDKSPLDKYITFNDKKEPVLNFSKNKGKLLKDVDSGFINWVLKNDFPQDLKTLIRKIR